MIIGVIQEVYTYVILNEFGSVPGDYNFVANLKILMIVLFLSGLMGGYVITFLLESWLRRKSFGTVLLNIFLIFTLVFFITAFTGTLLMFQAELNDPGFDEVIKNASREFLSSTYVRNYVFWLIVTLGTMIFLQVSDKYGPGGFRSLISGKHFRPKSDHRIFLFLDLRSSTSIAEQLGEELYFRLLRRCFRDMTNCILDHRGDIYQYVGDEVVVSWPVQRGIEKANCLHCYFDIQQLFASNASAYQKSFGVSPVFKAGLHLGRVTAGEIGVIKKDIAYSGDVLNTTARIQGTCNQLGQEVLISSELMQKLKDNRAFEFQSMGHIHLRGKSDELEVFTVRRKSG